MADLTDATSYWKTLNYAGTGDWLDESGSGHDWTISGVAFIGGKFVFVRGDADFMEIADHADFDLLAGTDCTLVLVCDFVDDNAFTAIWSKRDTVNIASGNTGWIWVETNTLLSRFIIDDGAAASRSDGLLLVTTADAVLAARRTAAAVQTYVNGATNSAADATTLTLANGFAMRLGSIAGGGNACSMSLSGAAFFRQALSDADIATVGIALLTPDVSRKVVRSPRYGITRMATR